MNNNITILENKRQEFLKNTQSALFIVLLLMVAGFFTWSENIVVTRAIKVFGRMSVMFFTMFIYHKILKQGAVNSMSCKNVFSPVFYVFYLVLGLASIMWSTNPEFSALQWVMIVQSLVFAYFFIKSLHLLDIYFKGHPIRLYHLLGNVSFVLLLVFVIGMWIEPETFFRLTNGGTEARLGGVIMNPNELGMLAGVGIACLIFDLYDKKNRIWTAIKILILFYALFLTGSRSSLIGVFLIVFFHLFQTKQNGLKWVILLSVLAAMPFAIYEIILKGGDQQRLQEILSLTGRLPFWKALITEGLPREPWLGFGFMRIDYNEFFQSTHTYPGKMTHNTFMQVLMNLGFIGFVMVFFQVLFTIRGIFLEKKENKLMLIGILIPIMINSFTEFGIFGESNYGILFYQLIIFYVSFKNSKYLTTFQKISLYKKHTFLNT